VHSQEDVAVTQTREQVLRERAHELCAVALRVIDQEFPYDIRSRMRRPDDFPHRPTQLYPSFYGAYDWHSSVEMHWLLVRLLRLLPEVVPAAEIRTVLERRFGADALAVEAQTFRERPAARPYGWGWALLLHHEIDTWDDPDARRWATHFVPLADTVAEAFVTWLPKQTYPIRTGAHNNSAFGLSRALPHARRRAESGDVALLAAIVAAARRWFDTDRNYPGGWEPSGADFLSAALVEAELQANLLPPAEFRVWFDAFLPALHHGEPAALLRPVTVSDDSDGQLAHLRGLNLSRAWAWLRLADQLAPDDPRAAMLRVSAAQHAEPELDEVAGTDYMVEHWLAPYALLYLTA
jgi:hypothetical protein